MRGSDRHSTRTLDELVELLLAVAIAVLDIRTIPRSRHNPQFPLLIPSRLLGGPRLAARAGGLVDRLRRSE